MLDVSKNKIDRLGIKFTDVMTSSMFGAVITGAAISTAFPLPGHVVSTHTFDKELTPGSVDFSPTPWKVYFDFIKQQSDTKVLARPRILTLNNETAEIKITTQEAIGTIQSQTGTAQPITTISAERIETGVSLRVTPQINLDTGDITMFINPIVKDATASTLSVSYKDPEERSTKSVIRIKDGDTVIVGGLIRNERSETITKLPILGDIPLIGGLFRHKYKDKDKERELLVFITPHIIKDTGIRLAKTKKAIASEREQDVVSGVNRESRIKASLNSFEKTR
jgi:type II secretory pathway component GspD/PulD (secretin)